MSSTPDQPHHDASLVEQLFKRVREDPVEAALLEVQLRSEDDEARRVMRAWRGQKAESPMSAQSGPADLTALFAMSEPNPRLAALKEMERKRPQESEEERRARWAEGQKRWEAKHAERQRPFREELEEILAQLPPEARRYYDDRVGRTDHDLYQRLELAWTLHDAQDLRAFKKGGRPKGSPSKPAEKRKEAALARCQVLLASDSNPADIQLITAIRFDGTEDTGKVLIDCEVVSEKTARRYLEEFRNSGKVPPSPRAKKRQHTTRKRRSKP